MTDAIIKVHSVFDLTKQKKEVKCGLKKALLVNDIWQPLAYTWFLSWKTYVDFDYEGSLFVPRSEEVISQYHDVLFIRWFLIR